MSTGRRETILLIGVGNEYRRDDGAGIDVARSVRKAALSGVRTLEASGEGASLLESMKDAGRVILVDAVFSGGEPGTIHRFEVPRDTIPADFFHYSTHAFSVAEAIALGRALDLLPARLTLFGIEGEDFGSGEGLSAPARRAADEVARTIVAELTCECAAASGGPAHA